MCMELQVYNYRPEKNAVVNIDDNASDQEIIKTVSKQTKFKSWVGFRLQ